MGSPGWQIPTGRSNIVSVRLSNGVNLAVHRNLAELIKTLCEATLKKGYPLHNGQCWGYAHRKIRGSSQWSNHSSGTAVDLNSLSNPMQSHLKTDMPRWMINMWKDCGFRWGGDYRHRKDAMHYEYWRTPSHVAGDVAKARRYLGGAVPMPARSVHHVSHNAAVAEWQHLVGVKADGIWGPHTKAATQHHMVKNGVRGNHVKWVQARVGAAADGIAGPHTVQAIKNFQAAHHLHVDGIAGPATIKALAGV